MMKLEAWHFLVAVLALVGPGLVWVGQMIGSLRERTQRNKDWIEMVDKEGKDMLAKMEDRLDKRFEQLGDTLREAILQSWRNCPLARNPTHVRNPSDDSET